MENNKEVATVEQKKVEHQKKGFLQWLYDLLFGSDDDNKELPPPRQKRVVLCPYCCGKIDTDYEKLEFVCNSHPNTKIEKPEVEGPLNPTCKECQKQERTTEPMPADSIRCNAPVPEGVDKCNKIVPYIMLDPEYTVYRISLVGTTSSGKTCFKSRLKSEIESNFLLGLFNYPHKDIHPLENGEDLPQSTEEKGEPLFENPDFIGFSIKEEDKNGNKKERKILLIIYDFAGEQVSAYTNTDNAKTTTSIKYRKIMLASDAVFFLIDPEQNFVNHLDNPNYDANNILGPAQVFMSNVIAQVWTDISAEAAKQKKINPNEEVRTPKLAYIFTKADKEYVFKALKEENDNCLKNNPGAGTELLWDNEGKPIYTDYDQDGIPNPQGIFVSLITNNDARYSFLFNQQPGFVKNRNDIRYFICSALGFSSVIGEITKKETDEGGREKEIKHKVITHIGPAFRVLDPLYWLIYGD